MIRLLVVLAIAMLIVANARPAEMHRVYIDPVSNVHVITAEKTDVQISFERNATRAELSPDRRTVVWLARAYIPGRYGLQLAPFSLKTYRNGHTREIACGQIIREYWFWMNGKRFGLECGGWHGAGHEILYDLAALNIVDEFDEQTLPARKRPAWSNSRNESD